MRVVARWHDEFALRAVEVAAPIRHDAVGAHGFGAVPISSLFTVAADDVVWDAGLLLLRSNGGRIFEFWARLIDVRWNVAC